MMCNGFPAEDYALYVLGNLPDPEQDEIHSHLGRGCEVCREQVRRSHELWYALALAAPMQEPPRAMRGRILAAAGEPRSLSLGWLWPAWAVLSTAALGVACVLLFTHPPVPRVAVRTVTVPAANSTAIVQLERENERLREQLRAQLAVGPVSPAPPSRAPDRNPELAALRTRLEQESASATAERERATGLEADLSLQKGLVAAAQRELQEANRRYAAANPDEAQRQLAAAAARSRELEREVEQYKALLAIERKRAESNLQLASLLSSPDLTLMRLHGTEKAAQ